MVSIRSSLFALASLAVAVSAVPSLELKVSGPDAIENVENLRVTATITNTGNESVKILKDPRGALSQVPTNAFSISDNAGHHPAFTGVKVKYVPSVAAAANAYTVLAPVGESYNFTAPGAGLYDIEANNKFLILKDDASIETVYASTPSAHASRVSGRLSFSRPAIDKRASFVSCSASRQSALNSAIAAAETMAANTYSYANRLSGATTRYTTWFGAYASSRRNTVVSHFQNLDANNFNSFTYDCSCTESGTYAYVYPSQFGRIYLCGAFWRAPLTGTDSQAGTIIHEASHFTRNGGTDDYAYGQTAAKNLARSNPNNAVMNADSHEYFAENTPFLS